MKIKYFFVFFAVLIQFTSFSQEDNVFMINPSFEDIPHMGTPDTYIKDWTDCGLYKFVKESPPDIHPAKDGKGFWENNLPAADGATYLGMVVRDNNTYESVGQKLSSPLIKNQCYSFTIYLARAARYVSLTHMTQAPGNYTTPIVLRIWGGRHSCEEFELLAESDAVDNSSWQINNFTIKPKRDIQYITFSAFYKTPTLFPYNGNILVDGASSFKRIPCPGEEIVAANVSKNAATNTSTNKPNVKTTKKDTNATQPQTTVTKTFVPKILIELDTKKIKKDQIIELKDLYFLPDSSNITKKSKPILDELAEFLKYTKNVKVEIGGHTNSTPSDEYCDKLSTARAKSVAEYLIAHGVDQSKVQFKGYGKRMPLMSNKTQVGRARNQRVELKILSAE